MSRPKAVPAYRLHRQSGQAIETWSNFGACRKNPALLRVPKQAAEIEKVTCFSPSPAGLSRRRSQGTTMNPLQQHFDRLRCAGTPWCLIHTPDYREYQRALCKMLMDQEDSPSLWAWDCLQGHRCQSEASMTSILGTRCAPRDADTLSRDGTEHARGGNASEQGGRRGTGVRCAERRMNSAGSIPGQRPVRTRYTGPN